MNPIQKTILTARREQLFAEALELIKKEQGGFFFNEKTGLPDAELQIAIKQAYQQPLPADATPEYVVLTIEDCFADEWDATFDEWTSILDEGPDDDTEREQGAYHELTIKQLDAAYLIKRGFTTMKQRYQELAEQMITPIRASVGDRDKLEALTDKLIEDYPNDFERAKTPPEKTN